MTNLRNARLLSFKTTAMTKSKLVTGDMFLLFLQMILSLSNCVNLNHTINRILVFINKACKTRISNHQIFGE